MVGYAERWWAKQDGGLGREMMGYRQRDGGLSREMVG
jgi:hypothetical protein